MICAPLALTLGDPDGIGPEITLKAWRDLRDEAHCFALTGDPDQAYAAALALDLPRPEPVTSWREARDVFADALPVIALPAAQGPRAALASIEAGVQAVLSGEAFGLVTNPVSKARLYEAGFQFPGHTEYLAHLTAEAPVQGPRGPVMMLAGGGLRCALVTIHQPLREAIAALTPERIIETARVTAHALKLDFAIEHPRLALAGLNPHAGEGGALGREEIDILAPALDVLRAEGLAIAGPMAPDTMFHAEARERYDAAVCLYHDQGLIPVKTLDFHGGVNVTLGLPIVRASPDHGTAFDIAGKGVARPDSLIAAIRLASDMAANRLRAQS
ncbi:4-hydroxythreonine-4-phosphate dehydrogenase PdxA [Alkalicaulis satelles]|uniref:4-hydroxythreonine-4-phosphate dehydrogenase n=1 Tax=Alkalicaulis satelles TaxID=2609175 RepID=A0A5M6ZLE2_9PROT|nr:4-hydroxythreonine-4-phosphate dehydrogenase PdxA [Alkalicaulis satelles]KAA5805150.1 4-hydroxythreonine-4-phosphate dehydrogenase PdxA [Alkalicaulis satelles]